MWKSYAGSSPLNSLKRETFVLEYIQDKNATQAAIRSGYSSKTAAQQGHRLLKNDDVKERTQYLMDQAAQEAIGNATDNLLFLIEARDLNISEIIELTDEFTNQDGEPVNPSTHIEGDSTIIQHTQRMIVNNEALKKYGHLIENISQGKNGIQLKLMSKLQSIKLLGDYHGLWKGEGKQEPFNPFDLPEDPNDPLYDKMLAELE